MNGKIQIEYLILWKNIINLFQGPMNIVAKIYFYSMWFVGTPVMIIFIIIYAFIGYGKFLNGP